MYALLHFLALCLTTFYFRLRKRGRGNIPSEGPAILVCNHLKMMDTACIIALCPPTAAICTMFASRYGQDTELSVSLVSLSTLLSVLTMPLMIVLAQSLPL